MAARYAANKQIHWKKSEAAFRGILDRVDSAAGRLVKSEKLIFDKVEYKIHIHPMSILFFFVIRNEHSLFC